MALVDAPPRAEPVRHAEPTRVCAGPCGERKPWSDFHAKVKWPDGTMRQPHAYCKACQREYTNDWHRRKRARDPEWQPQRQAKQYASIKADPERYAASLSYKRDWAFERYGYTRRKPRRSSATPGQCGRVDIAPFAKWLRTLDTTSTGIARATGLPDDRVRQYLAGKMQTVSLDVVDRACLHADADLNDLYPIEEIAA